MVPDVQYAIPPVSCVIISFSPCSAIRKAMITTVFGKRHRHRQQDGDNHSGGSMVPGIGSAEIQAATCVLWCTVALGYLVQSRPKALVRGCGRINPSEDKRPIRFLGDSVQITYVSVTAARP